MQNNNNNILVVYLSIEQVRCQASQKSVARSESHDWCTVKIVRHGGIVENDG